MSSLQEALNQRKNKIETAVSTKVSTPGEEEKCSPTQVRSEPAKPQEHQAHRRAFSA